MARQGGLVSHRLLIVTVGIETIPLHRQYVTFDRDVHVTAVLYVHSEMPLKVFAAFVGVLERVAANTLSSATRARLVAVAKGRGWFPAYHIPPTFHVEGVSRLFASLPATGRQGVTLKKRLGEIT